MVNGHLAVKKNRWYAILCLRHPDGRRYDKWIATGLSYPGNKRKAEAMLIELRRQHFNSHIWNAATLLSEYIPDWLKTRQKEISETTYSSYLQIANEIVRYFLNQDVRLSQISPHHIETYYQTLYERGLKSNSVLHHHALLHKALEDASRKGLIAENPMEKVKRPAKGRFIPHPYTAEEMKTLFAALQGHYMEVPIKLAAYYGLRRSEVLGLRWQAIDFEQETISVEHTICEVSQAVSNQKIIGRDTVKQKSSNRTLPMTPNIKALLLEYRGKHRQQNEHTATDYLFTDDSGNVIRPGHISYAFQKILKENDLRRIRFHDLRHSSAGILISNRVPLVEVQQWLGHSTIRITADLYAHLEYEIKKRSAAVMSDILFRHMEDSTNETN